MRARSEKGQRRVAYRHHSFPLLPGKWLQGKWGGRDGQQYARDIASGTHPNPLALCLFQRPTRLADGFGLKETTLLACGEIHPGKWVPRSPNGDSAPEPLRYYVVAIAGNAPSTRALVIWKKIGELLAPPDSHTSLCIWRQVFQGGAPLAAERISLRDPPQ
jgi:hypothetical protein